MRCKVCRSEESHWEKTCTQCGAKMPGASAYDKPPIDWGLWMWGAPRDNHLFFVFFRVLLLIFIGFWSVDILSSGIDAENPSWQFIHLINLVFHEAGHLIFGIFGNETLMILGGTLMQLLMPLLVGISFYVRHSVFAATVMFWWLGESLVDCSPYIGDAQKGELQLLDGSIGSETGFAGHDWHMLLERWDLLSSTDLIASLVFGIGGLLMIGTLVWATVVLVIQFYLGLKPKKRPNF